MRYDIETIITPVYDGRSRSKRYEAYRKLYDEAKNVDQDMADAIGILYEKLCERENQLESIKSMAERIVDKVDEDGKIGR